MCPLFGKPAAVVHELMKAGQFISTESRKNDQVVSRNEDVDVVEL